MIIIFVVYMNIIIEYLVWTHLWLSTVAKTLGRLKSNARQYFSDTRQVGLTSYV